MDNLEKIYALAVILITIVLIIFEIYVWITYGNKPASEVPARVWLWWK